MHVVDPPASHRERKKLATRRAIHQAAFDLVEAQGLSATTVEAISERAGVAPRTFWAYFPSKEDAVVRRDPEFAEALRAALLDRPADEDIVVSLRTVLEEYVTERLVDSDQSVRRQQLIRREAALMSAVAAMFNEMEQALVSAVGERLGVDPTTELLPGVLVAAVCGACRVAQVHWAEEKGRRSFHDLLDEAFTQLFVGFGPTVAGAVKSLTPSVPTPQRSAR